ncbi:MAG: hypothetical protein K6F95_04830, partial [Selenomonas sp.]|uniref:hypothetical protein n=1 Tax=Selenomonas sp. TaxID=2053611 RepID=UPI0025FD2978
KKPDIFGFKSVYTLNANAELIFGKQDKLFFSSAVQIPNECSKEMLILFHMKDYNTLYRTIDIALYYDFEMSSKEMWKAKLMEIKDRNNAIEYIGKNAKMLVIQNNDRYMEELLRDTK